MGNAFLWAAGLGTAALGTACTAGAFKLFNTVIPRQDTLKVDVSEMADMDKWEEYKKIMTPNREWLTEQYSEHITIKSRDGLTLHGDYFPVENGSGKIVICNHGYTGCGIRDCASIAVFFRKKLGCDCLVVDHRAHGQSEGEYIGFGILDRYDCREWVRYVKERFGSEKKILLYGISMGASTVLMASGFTNLQRDIKAIIADCAFTSPYEVFSHILRRDYHLPPFPIMNITDAICRSKAGYGFSDYSTVDAVRVTSIPILFIHGRNDDFVPEWMSEKNYKECISPKDLLIVENAAHGASYYENPAIYEKKVEEFLEKHIK